MWTKIKQRFREPKPSWPVRQIEAEPGLTYTIVRDGVALREVVVTHISFRHDGVSMEFEDKAAYIKARTLPEEWR